jgi:hypothetical protein
VSHRRLEAVVETLLAIVADVSLSARRGQATEGIGNQLQYSKRAALVRRATLQLIAHLRDPVSDVRFWSAFSLGRVWARRARKELQSLCCDSTVVEGWWSVGKEAGDAVAQIKRHQQRVCDAEAETTVHHAASVGPGRASD